MAGTHKFALALLTFTPWMAVCDTKISGVLSEGFQRVGLGFSNSLLRPVNAERDNADRQGGGQVDVQNVVR